MKYVIEHPSHLIATLREHPESFLKKGKIWVVINPGSFETYFCHSVNPKAVENLEEAHEIQQYQEGRWRLTNKKPVWLP